MNLTAPTTDADGMEDRKVRSSMDTHQSIAHLEEHRVDFGVITQPIDTNTSTGKLQLAILAVVAEFEPDLIVECIKHPESQAVGTDGASLGGTH